MSFLRAIVKAALFLTPYFYLLLIRTYDMNKTTLIVQSYGKVLGTLLLSHNQE